MPDFDPSKHLRSYVRKQKDLKTNTYSDVTTQYLDVRWRVMWVRTEHPDASVLTELIEHTDGYALFRATVGVPGSGSATGWGSETRQDFTDYLEKAETKAVGRALAHLGYGTAFAIEMDEGGSVADSPIEQKVAPTARELSGKPAAKPAAAAPVTANSNADEKRAHAEAVEVRRRLNQRLLAAMATANLPQSEVSKAVKDVFGAIRTGDLTDDQVEQCIDWIEDRRELRYDAAGTASLVPIEADGRLPIEAMPFEAATATAGDT